MFFWKERMPNPDFLAPLCPVPPSPPASGLVVNNPIIYPLLPEDNCVTTPGGSPINIQCHSFLTIYIESATAGRVQIPQYSPFCDATKSLSPACMNSTVVNQLRSACHGQVSKFKWFVKIFNINLLARFLLCLCSSTVVWSLLEPQWVWVQPVPKMTRLERSGHPTTVVIKSIPSWMYVEIYNFELS